MNVLSRKEENCEAFASVITKFATRENCLNKARWIDPVLREQFNFFNQFQRYQQGLILFSEISRFYDLNAFAPVKAYAVYFAYQLKSFETVKDIINTFFLEAKSENYKDSYDFCMMNFYKGQYYLSQYEYVKAAFCYLTTFKACASHNIINLFHVESIKRVILLNQLVEPIYRANINNFLNQNKKLLYIKPLEIYGELHKFLTTKTNTYKDLEKFAKDNTVKFKNDKINVNIVNLIR
jgi:hypothetical protein